MPPPGLICRQEYPHAACAENGVINTINKEHKIQTEMIFFFIAVALLLYFVLMGGACINCANGYFADERQEFEENTPC